MFRYTSAPEQPLRNNPCRPWGNSWKETPTASSSSRAPSAAEDSGSATDEGLSRRNMPATVGNGTLDNSCSTEGLSRDKRVVREVAVDEEECVVLGVLLSDDRRLCRRDEWNSLVLGSLVTGERALRRTRCHELRQLVQAQFPALPDNFVFLSRDGWPILKNQESSVRANKVINEENAIEIQKYFEKVRAGVVTQTGECLGFVFCDLNASLHQLRDYLDDQLKENRPFRSEYRFTDRNGWPASRQQEGALVMADVIANNSICIQMTHSRPLSHISQESTALMVCNSPRVSASDEPDGINNNINTNNNRKIRPTLKSYIWKSQGDQSNKNQVQLSNDPNSILKAKGLVAKPILISYVRAEAAEHALHLKEQLCKHGFSVYLDVHEIKTGSDWQDALNFAVSNCNVFVPLITPMYGKTQWTNREVKLADVLGKFIIPVNFMENWPPECLAIQFASTQYVSWKIIPQGEHAKIQDYEKETDDYRRWEPLFIANVSREIVVRCKTMFSLEASQKLRKTIKFKTDKNTNSGGEVNYALDNSGSIPDGISVDGRHQLVVISAHPRELLFAHRVKKCLEDMGYEVWCSIELMEEPSSVGEQGGGDVFFTSVPLGTIHEDQTFQQHSGHQDVCRQNTDEKRALCRLSSQMSSIGAMSESLTPDKIERLRCFQKKVNLAGLVVILVSHSFTNSSTSVQQIFYCEHRKKVLLIKVDNSHVPTLFSMLMGNDMLTNVESPQFIPALQAQVKRALNPKASGTPKDATTEAKMQYLVNFMKKNLPLIDHCVYISGSSKLQNQRSNEICRAIGRHLAALKDVNVVTGGFYGAGDVVARTFEEARLMEVPNNYAERPVVHILPVKDAKDFSQKAGQNEDGSFESVPYGKTMFLGDSVKERETAVARLFDICIVVEGGPGAAHEVEEFIWNDHFVIPIISTGGAAGGQFGVPLQILEAPPFVSISDWSVLSEKEASPETVAESVCRIVLALNQAVATHAQELAAAQSKSNKFGRGKPRRRSNKKSRRKRESALLVSQDSMLQNNSVVKEKEAGDDDYITESRCSGPNRWQKIFRFLRPTRIIS